MKKKIQVILIFSLIALSNCYGEDEFSYEKFQFLEDTEWYLNFSSFNDGEVKFIRMDKYEKLLQQKWWSGSFDIFADIGDNKIIHLGASAECNIEYRNNLSLMIIHCPPSDEVYSSVVDRMSDVNPTNNILGRWSIYKKNDFLYEYRELPWDDDYVYLFYIEGLERRLEGERQNDIFSGWFLLKYEGNGVFETDGIYDDDKYILKIVHNETLRFYTDFEHDTDYDDAPIVDAYYQSKYDIFAKKD